MKRRAFLAGILAAGALAGTSIRCIAAFKPLEDDDFTTENLRYKCTERFSYGYTDPRAFFGSTGTVATARDLVEASGAPDMEYRDISRYLASPNTWYVKTEDRDGLKLVSRDVRRGLFERFIGGRA